MPASPRTPRHSPHPSIDFSRSASYSPHERRHQNPRSIRRPRGYGGGNGLGNLADELGDAFSDSEEDDDEYYDNQAGAPGINLELDDDEDEQLHGKDGIPIRDSGVDVESPNGLAAAPGGRASLSLPSPNGRGHRRAPSEYDGSEYGSDSDLDSPGMPLKLVEKMDEVESLARRGTENNGSSTDGTFQRVTDGLRDLSSQSGVEGGASSSMASHSQFYPPSWRPPDAETIDTLLPMLVSLSEYMPRPSTSALNSLASLHSITSDLVQTLNYVSDTLHMSRQTTTTATRRLKSARELVAEMKEEEELREEGERWITRGNWGERLRKRECADVCGEVVGGFEEVCNNWRARLLAQAESSQA
ncbi:hypothetical protein B0T22DRAFT_502683 [Podospora appendiculata]|uniref:Uncharacterized protein n=1 Tax=Podospora appendiculata TaxID=314037 RepID=A0AAE1C6U9_9PEZI|nr:hypothetical protein B0T22DRAFT_502683 [Podospora appendiculata]